MTLKNYTFLQLCQMLIVPAFFATLKMLVISGIMSTIFGFIFGVILVITEKGGLCENVVVNRILDFLVNTIRSFPFIILLISIIPFTRLIVGTSIGETAALVPLTVACSPFMALRICSGNICYDNDYINCNSTIFYVVLLEERGKKRWN